MTNTAPTDSENELRVSARTPTADLAAAISHALYDSKETRLRCIGAGAVNQAVKALCIAGGYVGQRGLSLATRPGFVTVDIDDQERTAILFYVFTTNR